MRWSLVLILCIALLGCLTPGPTPPVPLPPGWSWKLATDPDDVLNFLNGTGAYGSPAGEARISVIWKGNHSEFYVFYRPQPASGSAGGWGWKLATEPDDVYNFLNGLGTYAEPVKDAQIAAMWKANHPEFYVFYQNPAAGETVEGNWAWKLAPDPSDAMNFLNGTGAYQHPVTTARIAALEKNGHDEFYIFYQGPTVGNPINNWYWKLATAVDDAHNFINGQGAYGKAVKGFDFAGMWKGTHNRFYMFANQGTRAWRQSPLEDERFVKDEPVHLRALITSDQPADSGVPTGPSGVACKQIEWTSDKDGLLGKGLDLTINTLTVGKHKIVVAGCGDEFAFPVRVFENLEELYKSAPSQGEIDRIEDDFNLVLIDDTVLNEKWSSYDPYKFDQTSTDPSKMVIISQLDILRHQRFSELLPFTQGDNIYDHIKKYLTTIALRLDCTIASGKKNGQIDLGRAYHVWHSPAADPSVANWCKIIPDNPSLFLWRIVPGIIVHEARHCEPSDVGHVICDGKSMDQELEGPGASGWAQDALYSMWVYKYGLYDSDYGKQYAKEQAQLRLQNRFCTDVKHSNPKVQAIIKELLGQ